MLPALDHIVSQAREQEVFSREDVPTEVRVWAAFLYHAGLSYRKVGLALGHSHEAVHQWYHQLAELFEPEPDRHAVVAVDGTKIKIEDVEIYVWAAIDVETSPGRSELDVLLILLTVLKRCRGEPVIITDRGSWYNWPLNDLDLPCHPRRETWGERSLIESWFTVFKFRTRQFFDRFLYHSSWKSVDRWANAFATIHNVRC